MKNRNINASNVGRVDNLGINRWLKGDVGAENLGTGVLDVDGADNLGIHILDANRNRGADNPSGKTDNSSICTLDVERNRGVDNPSGGIDNSNTGRWYNK